MRWLKSKDYHENRYHPQDAERHEDLETGAEWWTKVYPQPGGKTSYTATGYSGKRSNPDFNYSFLTLAHRDEYIAKWLAGLKAHAARKIEERKVASEFVTTLQVGDVLHGSWGYDQTNCEWWEVTRIIGKQTVEVRKIKADYRQDGFMSGYETPCPHEFTDDPPEIKRVGRGYQGDDLLSWGLYVATKWSGSPAYSSSYA